MKYNVICGAWNYGTIEAFNEDIRQRKAESLVSQAHPNGDAPEFPILTVPWTREQLERSFNNYRTYVQRGYLHTTGAVIC